MGKYLVVLNDKTEQIYIGYTQDELVSELHAQGITDADVYIIEEDSD